MRVYLIHLDPDHGPVGVWCVADDGIIGGYYPDTEFADRAPIARALLNARGNNVPWLSWCEQLAARLGYTAAFDLVRDEAGVTPHQIWTRHRTDWVR